MAKAKAPSAAGQGFDGFAPGALDFFTELDAHQTRDWFTANKARYEQTIRDPLERLVGSLSFAFAVHEIPLVGDAKSSLFRINRDIRFSKDKRPYKTHAGAVLTRDGVKQSQGLVYIQLGPHDCFAAAGFYALEPPELERFRRKILADPQRWSDVEAALAQGGLSLSMEGAAVSLPRGYHADQVGDLGDIIRLKSFIVRQPLERAEVESPVLIDRVVALAQTALPLLRFGWSALAVHA